MPGRLPPRLIGLTPGTCDGARAAATLLAQLRGLAGAGLTACLVREPGLDDRDFLWLAHELRAVFAVADGAWLGIHDRVHVALTADADAVHLGFRSLRPLEARRALDSAGRSLAIGLSTHAGDDPKSWVGADYFFHGPIFATPSKEGLLEPIGPAGVARAAAARPDPRVPLFALGGITAESVAAVRASGADGVAVLGAFFGPSADQEGVARLVSAVGSWGSARA